MVMVMVMVMVNLRLRKKSSRGAKKCVILKSRLKKRIRVFLCQKLPYLPNLVFDFGSLGLGLHVLHVVLVVANLAVNLLFLLNKWRT